MRKILLPWGGEMGIISLRCRVSAASGGASPAAGGGVLVTPCRCRAILFSSSLYHLLIGRATRIGPSRAAGKNFNLRGTGRNVRGGHSCFLCKSGGRQVLCCSQKRRHKNSSPCRKIARSQSSGGAAACGRQRPSAIANGNAIRASESSLADKIDINKMCVFKIFEWFRRRVRRFF